MTAYEECSSGGMSDNLLLIFYQRSFDLLAQVTLRVHRLFPTPSILGYRSAATVSGRLAT